MGRSIVGHPAIRRWGGCIPVHATLAELTEDEGLTAADWLGSLTLLDEDYHSGEATASLQSSLPAKNPLIELTYEASLVLLTRYLLVLQPNLYDTADPSKLAVILLHVDSRTIPVLVIPVLCRCNPI
jgi:hypothetical protein